jgi:hypothetical protein
VNHFFHSYIAPMLFIDCTPRVYWAEVVKD